MLRLLLLTTFVASTGCDWVFPKPWLDTRKPLLYRRWNVRCAWVIGPRGEPGEPPGPSASGWEWATDAAGRRLVLEGHLEDGFLRVNHIHAGSEQHERDIVPIDATARTVNALCAATVRRAVPTAELYGFGAVRGLKEAEVAMAFPDDPNGPQITRLVIFGDSLSDPGNLKEHLTVMPGSPYWLGRFSGGPNWVDWLAWNTGLAVQNHAYGGAVATKHEDVPAAGVLAAIEEHGQFLLTGSVDRQVDEYIKFDLKTGSVKRPFDTLYFLWAGANDYISKEPFTGDIRSMLDTPEEAAGYHRVVEETVTSLAGQIRRLYGAGARRFMVVDLPNLGQTPMVLHNTSYQPRGVTSEDSRRVQLALKLADLTAYHNSHLAKAMSDLAGELSGARLVVVQINRIIDLMRSGCAPDGSCDFDFGFAAAQLRHEITASGHTVRLQDRCYQGNFLGTRDAAKVCPEAARAVFWDALHPGTYAHCWLAGFFQMEMVRAGFLERAPTSEEYRRYCQAGIPQPESQPSP